MKRIFTITLIYVCISKTYCDLKLCNTSVTITQLCKRFEDYRANAIPNPTPLLVTPIIDLKNILYIEPDKKTLSLYINFIMDWQDHEIYVNPSIGQKYVFIHEYFFKDLQPL